MGAGQCGSAPPQRRRKEPAGRLQPRQSADRKALLHLLRHRLLPPGVSGQTGQQNSKWVCSGKIKNGADSCASFPIYEDEIKPLLLDVFRDTEASAEALIEEYVEMFKSLDRGGRLGKQITILQKQLETVEQKRMKLLTYNAQGKLDDADFLAMNKSAPLRQRNCKRSWQKRWRSRNPPET